jgi:hypothetical protein
MANVTLRGDSLTLNLDRSGPSPILRIICPNISSGEFQQVAFYPQADPETSQRMSYVRPSGELRNVDVYFWLNGGTPNYRLVHVEDSIPVKL